jgi:uncharacterized membrane protein YcaP (DUF421 family)
MELEGLLGVALRATVTYCYVLITLRVTGKRTIGQMSLPDAAAAFIIGDMFDDLIWGEVAVAKGITGIGALMLLHLLVVFGVYRSRAIAWLLEGPARLMVKGGHVMRENMAAERIRREEVEEQLREKGVARIEEVAEGHQEQHDHMSVVKAHAHRPAQKRDLPELEALLR